MKQCYPRLVLGLLGVMVWCAAGDARAADRVWDGGAGDNFWQSAGNWNPDGYATSDNFTVDSPVTLAVGSNVVRITGNGSLTVAPTGVLDVGNTSDLQLEGNAILTLAGTLRRTSAGANPSHWFRFGNSTNQNVTINHTGTLSSTAPAIIGFNQNSGGGQTTYNMSAGIFDAANISLGWSYGATTTDVTATFNQSGTAVVKLGSYLSVGQSGVGSTNSNGKGTGYYNISGGTLDAANVVLGDTNASTSPSFGYFTQSGGLIGGTTRPTIRIAHDPESTGAFTIRGGTLRAASITDSGTGVASTLRIQGGAATIDVNGSFSFTDADSTIIAEVGSGGLSPISVTGTATADLGTSTDLKAGVYGGFAYNPSNSFTVLQLASGSITGSFVDQAAPLWTLTQNPTQVSLSLAPGAEKPQLLLSTHLLTGLNDPYGWLEVVKGDFSLSSFGVRLDLAGNGSATNLATWMTEAGLDATGDDATHSVVLRGLTTPTGSPSYFFWDLRDFNAQYGANLALTGISLVPEPSTWLLLALGLLACGVFRRSFAWRGV